LLAACFVPLVIDPEKEERDDCNEAKHREDDLPASRTLCQVRFGDQGKIFEGIARIRHRVLRQ
jgi:hypothetical protein